MIAVNLTMTKCLQNKKPAFALAIFDYKRLFFNIMQHYVTVNLTFVPISKYTCADLPWFQDGSSHIQSRFRDNLPCYQHHAAFP
ncbi:Uncharacterised protein [Chlamydia trachomatis]|nr:Uncharacterised protein [Chlamydia trachomatis]